MIPLLEFEVIEDNRRYYKTPITQLVNLNHIVSISTSKIDNQLIVNLSNGNRLTVLLTYEELRERLAYISEAYSVKV